MKLTTERPRCSECKKTASIALCFGCEQAFCTRHFIRHRLHLGTEMEDLHHQFQSIEKCLCTDPNEHPTMSQIYAWERKSIRRIQEIAEAARHDLRQWIEETRIEVQQRLKMIDEEFRTHENFDNFTEIDLQRWTKQLNELKELSESPTKIPVIEEKKPSTTIGTLKIVSPRLSISSSSSSSSSSSKINGQLALPSPHEHFLPICGPCHLSENNLVVTQRDYRAGFAQITGQNEYSSGRHSIEFLIENKGQKNLFIGIHSPSVRSDSKHFDSSVHGWWNFDHMIINGESHSGKTSDSLRTGDSVRLILNCDQRNISLEHHRTDQSLVLPIELDQCPFPWKILVRLLTTGDQLRIIG